jgi:hypothetical protein
MSWGVEHLRVRQRPTRPQRTNGRCRAARRCTSFIKHPLKQGLTRAFGYRRPTGTSSVHSSLLPTSDTRRRRLQRSNVKLLVLGAVAIPTLFGERDEVRIWRVTSCCTAARTDKASALERHRARPGGRCPSSTPVKLGTYVLLPDPVGRARPQARFTRRRCQHQTRGAGACRAARRT